MALAALAGCCFSGSSAAIPSPVALRGTVHGGQQPVTGARVQRYAAGTTGAKGYYSETGVAGRIIVAAPFT